MQTLNIENTKYVLVAKKDFEKLQKIAASKAKPQKKLSLEEGKKLALNLIDKWTKEK